MIRRTFNKCLLSSSAFVSPAALFAQGAREIQPKRVINLKTHLAQEVAASKPKAIGIATNHLDIALLLDLESDGKEFAVHRLSLSGAKAHTVRLGGGARMYTIDSTYGGRIFALGVKSDSRRHVFDVSSASNSMQPVRSFAGNQVPILARGHLWVLEKETATVEGSIDVPLVTPVRHKRESLTASCYLFSYSGSHVVLNTYTGELLDLGASEARKSVVKLASERLGSTSPVLHAKECASRPPRGEQGETASPILSPLFLSADQDDSGTILAAVSCFKQSEGMPVARIELVSGKVDWFRCSLPIVKAELLPSMQAYFAPMQLRSLRGGFVLFDHSAQFLAIYEI